MRIAIIDDEKIYQNKIEEYLKHFKKINISEIIKFNSGEEFFKDNSDYALVFVDVEMPGMNGFDTIKEHKKLHKTAKYIIVTTHEELSRNGYKVEAFRYLFKSNLEEEIVEALNAVCDIIKSDKDIKVLIDGGNSQKIKLNNIIYFEILNRKIILHTITEKIICKGTLSEFEEKLKNENFYLTHRAYLINMMFIKEINSKEVLMKNGDKVFLSRRKYSELKSAYIDYKFNNANK